MKKLGFILCLPFLFASTCENDDNIDDIVCTEEAKAGLNVTVKDLNTNQILNEGVIVKATDGLYVELLESFFPTQTTFFGAWERTGNYTLTVTKVGYETYVSDVITVTRDVCHVIPKQIEVKLTPQ